MENAWDAIALTVVIVFLASGIVELFLRFVLPHFLSDAQRYGIDENGVAQNPDYLDLLRGNHMAAKPKKSLEQRIADADELASRWLADGNEALDTGHPAKAKKCFERSQYWMDRYTLLTNQAEKPAPKE